MIKSKDIHIPKTDNELDKENYKKLEKYIDNLKTTKGALINILHRAQHIFGYLPKEVQLFIARKLGISGAEVYGVVSFYSYFSTKPSGKHIISVCMGTACFVRGSDKILEKLKKELGIEPDQTTDDGLFTLKSIRCIGACGLAPVIMIDDKVYGKVTEEELTKILNTYRNVEEKQWV